MSIAGATDHRPETLRCPLRNAINNRPISCVLGPGRFEGWPRLTVAVAAVRVLASRHSVGPLKGSHSDNLGLHSDATPDRCLFALASIFKQDALSGGQVKMVRALARPNQRIIRRRGAGTSATLPTSSGSDCGAGPKSARRRASTTAGPESEVLRNQADQKSASDWDREPPLPDPKPSLPRGDAIPDPRSANP
jgi:hypothetical protein